MAKNIRVIGSYKCGCSYGPVREKDRLEYCGVHGDEIANEYEVPSLSAPNKVLQSDEAYCTCQVFIPSYQSTAVKCRTCGGAPRR